MDILNPSAYLIKDGSTHRGPGLYHQRSKPPPNTLPLKTTDLQKPAVAYSDRKVTAKPHTAHTLSHPHSAHGNHTWNNPNPRQCHNLNSSSSYPDSDYLSLSSNHNYSKGHMKPYQDLEFSGNLGFGPGSQNAYTNLSYDYQLQQYGCNSTRDDDETTTTSGSYTINHDDVDEDLAHYRTSQVV